MSLQNSHRIENVKMMLVKGIDGKGITTIEKTSTSGLVDTYTITYTDGTKDTFTVTNGKGISSIEKTGTSGLVDTYTITFNDGTTGTFTVTNGKSIVSIEKTGTVGLTDTYTITYNDGSTDTFEVVNGGYDVGDQNTATGNPLSFTTNLAQVSQGTDITLEPIQSGSGDPSPNNQRPFVGYDEIDLASLNNNLWTDGDQSGTKFQDVNVSLPIGTYLVSAYVESSDTDADVSQMSFRDSNDSAFISLSFKRNCRSVKKVTLTQACASIRFRASTDSSSSTGDTFNFTNIIITSVLNVLTDIQILLDETLYGGMIVVESGLLTVTHVRVDMGDLGWTYQSAQNQFYATISDKAKGATNVICDSYATFTTGTFSNLQITGTANNSNVYVKDTSYSTAPDFTTAVTGKYIVYELATPLTYHLTPHQVKLLQGANVVTSNGTSISLKWREGQVMTLDDANGLAESIEALGEQGTKVKTFTPETSATMWSDVIDFFLALPLEKQLTAKIFVNYKWYSPAYVNGDDTYFVSGDISAGKVSSTPTISYMRATKSGLKTYSFACDTGTVSEGSQYGVPTLYYLD